MSGETIESVRNAECGASLPDCAWGAAIEASYAARPVPELPEGWTRVFESHFDCAPAVLVYMPGDSHAEPVRPDGSHRDPALTIHAHGVQFGIYCEDFDARVLAVVMPIAAADQTWLEDFERCCCDHDCKSEPP
jgi:hypothetical protein